MPIATSFTNNFDLLHQQATERTGLEDFGDSDYHNGLRNVLAALDFDHASRMNPKAQENLSNQLIDILVARLYTQAGWQQYPEYRQVTIKRPLIIMGLPRTGTTALHRLLSLDDQFQGVAYWLYRTPMPRPPRADWDNYPTYRALAATMAQARKLAPQLFSAHAVDAEEVDECIHGLKQSFVDPYWAMSFDLPSHEDWVRRQDATDSYRRYADLLRLVGLPTPEKTWLLKNPSHMFGMEALLKVFPDACIIQTHRHPLTSIASMSSLMSHHQQRLFDRVRHKAIGATQTRSLHQGLTHAEWVRHNHPQHYYDVHQRDFNDQPMQVVRGIYQHFGFELSDQVAERMQQWLDAQPASEKRGHHYHPDDFGLDKSVIDELFAEYIERYAIDH